MSGTRSSLLPRSAPGRFVLLCLLLVLVSTIPVLLFVYHQAGSIMQGVYRERVEDREAALLQSYRTGGIAALTRVVENPIESGAAAHGAILLADSAGRPVAGNMRSWPAGLGEAGWDEQPLLTDGRRQPGLFLIRTTRLPSGERLLVGTAVEDRHRMREALVEALLGALALAIPIGLAAGFILLRSTNRRIEAIGDVARRIAGGDLSHRVEAVGESEAFERLAGAINAMLARIEELVEQLRLVTDSLAHDLRSPLTRMRASLERAATSPEAREQALEAISSEMDGMLRLISATLDISRTEAGIGREHFAHFDLGILIRDLCEMYHPVAEDRGVAMSAEGSGNIAFVGNRELIGQAVSNLIDNALNYAGEGGEIRIGADEQDSSIRLWVADRGPGIPDERRAEALRKYARLEAARTTEGSGLGLALVRAVARLHGGELALEDNRPGLRAELVLPKTPASGGTSGSAA